MLLEASQHSVVALIKYRAAEPLDVARASTQLLRFHCAAHGRTGNAKFQSAGDQWETFLRGGRRCYSTTRGRYRYGYLFCSDHHQIDPAIFKAFACETIPRHCSIRFQF